MANLVASRLCNLHCSFCFARDYLLGQPAAPFLTMETYEQCLDFLARSGMDEVRLIGGEPTLHPQFGALLERALQRFARVVVFSNGLIGEQALAALVRVPPSVLTVMVNASATGPGGGLTAPEQAQRARVLRSLGSRAMLGYTISAADFDADFLIPLICDHHCRPSLRLGLAQPALDGSNASLSPRHYPRVGERIAEFASSAATAGIRVELDCGFVRCMFSTVAAAKLARANALVVSRCNPVLDVDLDGQASHCFPLASRFSAVLRADSTAQELREELSAAVRAYRTAGIYPECSSCTLRQTQECSGGCLAWTIRRFRPAAFHLRIPEALGG